MSNRIINIIALFIVIHMLFGIWIYGNPHLLNDESESNFLNITNFLRDFVKVSSDSYLNQIVKRFTDNHNIIMLAALIVIFLMLVFKLTLVELFLSCLRKSNSFANRSNEKRNNLDIGISKFIKLAIPLKSLYKGYMFRKIKFARFLKTVNCKELPIGYYKSFYRKGIKYDREIIAYRLKKELDVESLPLLDEDFDENLKEYLELIDRPKESFMKRDISYNIAVLLLNLV